ncbi:hypothetical protein [Aurantivibrio infirmus]
MKKEVVKLTSAALLFFAASAPEVLYAETKSLKDGVYTAEQAESGKAVYQQFCSACHVPAFYQDKLNVWKNQPLSGLYDSIVTSMPGDNPGALLLQEYTDVLAYIFSTLNYPSGETALNHEDGSMESIIIAD